MPIEKLRYFRRNPVTRGLRAPRGLAVHPSTRRGGACRGPRLSSFRDYATGEDCGVKIESRWTVDTRNRNAGETLPSSPSDSDPGRDRKKAPG